MTDDLIGQFARLDGAEIGDGAFSAGPAVWVGTREVAHVDSDGLLDVRLTKQVIRSRRSELRGDPRISLRASGSDWLAIRIESPADVETAIALVRDAISANLPTAKPGTPPTGADLARRRRFH